MPGSDLTPREKLAGGLMGGSWGAVTYAGAERRHERPGDGGPGTTAGDTLVDCPVELPTRQRCQQPHRADVQRIGNR